MSIVKQLSLSSYRNYEHSQMNHLEAGFVVVTGQNGAGKTNCLEAVSLLGPGRGVRNAKPQELRRAVNIRDITGAVSGAADGDMAASTIAIKSGRAHADPLPWVVRADLFSTSRHVDYDDDLVSVGTGENPAGKGRVAKVNGEKISALSRLSEIFSCVWFTPAMSGLFMGGVSERRRFFDRVVFSYDPSHAGRVRRYEKLLSERSKILKDALNAGRAPDARWLNGVETGLAETSVALAASRLELLGHLSKLCVDVADGLFPPIEMDLCGGSEELLHRSSALVVEDGLRESFAQNRVADAYTGGSATQGAHRSDLMVTYLDKNMAADQCSTGEQKAMLLTIILAHAKFIHGRSGMPPAILLDEITAHLDEHRRLALFDILRGLKGQVWMSGTEKSLFDGVSDAQFFHVENAQISAR